MHSEDKVDPNSRDTDITRTESVSPRLPCKKSSCGEVAARNHEVSRTTTTTNHEGATTTNHEGATTTNHEAPTTTNHEGATTTNHEGAITTNHEAPTTTNHEAPTTTNHEAQTTTTTNQTNRDQSENDNLDKMSIADELKNLPQSGDWKPSSVTISSTLPQKDTVVAAVTDIDEEADESITNPTTELREPATSTIQTNVEDGATCSKTDASKTNNNDGEQDGSKTYKLTRNNEEQQSSQELVEQIEQATREFTSEPAALSLKPEIHSSETEETGISKTISKDNKQTPDVQTVQQVTNIGGSFSRPISKSSSDAMEIRFGFRPIQINAEGKVQKAKCLFCAVFGTETETWPRIHVATSRTPDGISHSNLRRHLNIQHFHHWTAYNKLDAVAKPAFFQQSRVSQQQHPLHRHTTSPGTTPHTNTQNQLGFTTSYLGIAGPNMVTPRDTAQQLQQQQHLLQQQLLYGSSPLFGSQRFSPTLASVSRATSGSIDEQTKTSLFQENALRSQLNHHGNSFQLGRSAIPQLSHHQSQSEGQHQQLLALLLQLQQHQQPSSATTIGPQFHNDLATIHNELNRLERSSAGNPPGNVSTLASLLQHGVKRPSLDRSSFGTDGNTSTFVDAKRLRGSFDVEQRHSTLSLEAQARIALLRSIQENHGQATSVGNQQSNPALLALLGSMAPGSTPDSSPGNSGSQNK